MIKIENIDVWGFEHAIRGMRNPLNSWDKSDSYACDGTHCSSCKQNPETRNCSKPDGFYVGKNDLDLMKRLYKAGTEHRKYLRQIFVSMDVVAPLYLWKEADQYRIGVTTNSCSTMHKIAAKKFELDDFSHEHMKQSTVNLLKEICKELNDWRYIYLNGSGWCGKHDKEVWWQMIQLLPSSYNQRRTITMNYENVVTMIKQRTGHKLDEWRTFVEQLKELPYIKEIIADEG